MVKFGGIDLDPIEIGINGNAILGIKESGKSYLGTKLGELFFDANIPFVTFDPIGIWHNMRYPGRGKGYPVVVAGGFHGDMPLSAATAPAIVEAAMKNRVSLVLDLFHPDLSKREWRKIVRDCALLLLHKNAQFGLRHIFIEEAAEFVPQRPTDWEVYEAVERVIRMGGNSRLGCTLISPRSQEVNKAVLELAENMFLFRQRGKNALENLKKWLDVAGAAAGDVMKTLPSLPTGECWAWLGGSDTPVHVKVPPKNSFHPDRRAQHGEAGPPAGKAVAVDKFVAEIKGALPAIEEEAKASDPKLLRAEIARLQKEGGAADLAAVKARADRLEGELQRVRPIAVAVPAIRRALDEAWRAFESVQEAVKLCDGRLDQLEKLIEGFAPSALVGKEAGEPPRPPVAAVKPPRQDPAGLLPNVPAPADAGDITPGRQKILEKIAWGAVFFNDSALERGVLGFLVGKHQRTKSFLNDLSALRSAGYIDYLSGNRIALTDAGRERVPPVRSPSRGDLIAGVKSVLSNRQSEMLDLILEADLNSPVLLNRADLAAAFGLHERTKSFLNDLSRMKTLGLITYAAGSAITAASFLKVKAA